MIAYAEEQSRAPHRMTRAEYLTAERHATIRSEYHGGIVIGMAGASPEHNTIVSNVHGELYLQLRGRPCRPFVKDLRVRVPKCDKDYYPDVVVACDEPRYEELNGMLSLLNPTLLVEVLSRSTERKDRGEKWMCYQTLPSLQTYVLITQESPLIEIYQRQDNGWLYASVTEMAGSVGLDSIGCVLRLSDVYARLPIDQAASAGEEGQDGQTISERG
jgi:Uma2 family endonuclease